MGKQDKPAPSVVDRPEWRPRKEKRSTVLARARARHGLGGRLAETPEQRRALALRVLVEVAEDTGANEAARVGAAKALLEHYPEPAKAIPAWAPPEQPAPKLDMSPEQDPSWS